MSTTGFVSQEIARMRSSILEYCVERFWLSGVHAVMQIILFLFIALMMALVLPVELIHAETNQETFSREEQYCQRLREGGLYEILEGYINRKLKQPRLTEELRLLYTLELGRTYADHATTISGESQQLYWQQSFDLLNKEIAAHPESTGILRVKVEKSCLMAVKTQHYCRVLELISDPQNYKNQVIKDGTQAVIELESLSKELNDLIKSQGEKIKAGGLKIFQLQLLEFRVLFELSRLNLNLAELQKNNAVESGGHLIQAERILKRLTAGWSDEPLTQQSWVLLARLYRLKKEAHGFQMMKKGLEGISVPEGIKDRIIAEEVQFLLNEEKVLEAEELARNQLKVKLTEREPAGELVVWHIQSLKRLAELSEKKGNKQLSEDLLKQVASRTERLKNAGDLYWVQWLEARKVQQNVETKRIPELAELLSMAEKQYQSGEFKLAVSSYQKLSGQAFTLNHPQESFQWGYMALSIMAKNSLWKEITHFVPGFYERFKQHEKACDVHFLWILAEHQLLPQPMKKSPELEIHIERMQEHLKIYRDKPTSSRVRFYMGQTGDELKMNGAGVRRFYLMVDPEGTEYSEAVRLAAVSLLREFEISDQQSQVTFSKEWQEVFKTAKEELFKKSSSVTTIKTQLVLLENEILWSQLSDVLIKEISNRIKEQELWLQNVINNGPKADETVEKHQLEQKSAAVLLQEVHKLKSLLLFCLKDLEGVKKMNNTLEHMPADSRYFLILRMENYSKRWGTDRPLRYQVSEVELQLINQLNSQSTKLSETQQDKIIDLKIEALTETSQFAQARKELEEVLRKRPDQSALTEKLINMYLESGTPQSLTEASGLIRKLEAKQKPGSEQWFNFRILLLETGFKQNQLDETRKLLKLTRILYPKGGTEEQRKRLTQLDEKLKR